MLGKEHSLTKGLERKLDLNLETSRFALHMGDSSSIILLSIAMVGANLGEAQDSV